MVKHNNVLPNVHLRKHWGRFVRTWFDQPAKKLDRYTKRKSKAEKIAPRPLRSLRPIVAGQTNRHNGKLRYGKGFTLEELKKSGLTAKFARTVGIAVDHRRVNANEEALARNLARLAEYKNKMILFPLKDGKFKKGEISDSTKEQVESEAAKSQNTTRHVLDMPKVDNTVEWVPITDDMKKHRAYQQIRQAQVNHKYSRKRYRMGKYKEACDAAAAEGKEKPKTRKQMRLKK
jgi:large subunit ribosomal protein L13e